MQQLPLQYNFFEPTIIKKLIKAHKALAELNWLCHKIPNQKILINSLLLQEAKDSSEIENIITTHDELYKAQMDKSFSSPQSKEVENYKEALLYGFGKVQSEKLLLNNDIIAIQALLEKNDAWFRTQMGTKLMNDQTWETVYTPPQSISEIQDLMTNLEWYINDNNDDLDPLIKMAVIHHQFESIHPFYDGNGRTGRIINILYLIKNDLLTMPILYLSKYIIKHKAEYYKHLQQVRDQNTWNEWVLYMLDAVEKTAIDTMQMIQAIWDLMGKTKKSLKTDLPKIYSKDLLEIIFSHPYTKIDFLVEWMGMSRQRASRYLQELVDHKYMTVIQIKNSKYFIHNDLFALLKKWLWNL